MKKVFVKGLGITQFGELWDKDMRELGIEAAYKAIKDAGLSKEEIDAAIVSNMSAGMFTGQEHVHTNVFFCKNLILSQKSALNTLHII